MVTTDGYLLNRKVIYRQPAVGYRSGIEPVLLAASVPARAGEAVLEAGTGAGAALLCLAARVRSIRTTGIEIDAAMAELAAGNAQANGFTEMQIIADHIETIALPRPFDHAIANPPYHSPDGSASPDAGRDAAKRGSNGLIQVWTERLSGALRRRGSLTLIVPAGVVPTCVVAMANAGCPCTVLYPLWPKAGSRAKLVLIRGIKNSRTPMRLLPGLILHQPDGSFTEAARAILEDAAALSLDG